MILFLLSFVAGILTILAPCVLPLLPVIVGSSVGGGVNKRKALTISLSLGVSVILFTLVLKVSTLFITIPSYIWSIVSGIIIIIFGLVSLFPNLWDKLSFVSKMNKGSNKMLANGYKKQSFLGDIIIGASLGPVFSTCSPTYFVILATVLPQSFWLGLIDLLAYSAGLSGSLLLIAFLGQKLTSRFAALSDTNGKFKRGLGLVFIVLGLFIVFGIDKIVEAKILSSGFFDITSVEQKLLRFNEKPITQDQISVQGLPQNTDTNICKDGTCTPTTTVTSTGVAINKKQIASSGPVAPQFVNPDGYINTGGAPIKLSDYKGKNVVLLDIWTYSCINCQRTLPYVTSWYSKYKDQGLVVIGIHTPEFAFEKVQKNVEDAVKKFGITYPVILDNDYKTWNAYGNQYWPRKYLINANGEIIYDHIGEGDYDKTEAQIVKALSELNNKDVSIKNTLPANTTTVEQTKVRSPEIYFGSARNQNIATLGANGWTLSGEYAESKNATNITYTYEAKNVYMVASSNKGMNIDVYVDGIKTKTVFIKENQLYTLVEGTSYGQHKLELKIPEAGLEAYTFTFG